MKHHQVLEIQFEYDGERCCHHPVLLLSEKDVVLVDCGYPGFSGQIAAGMREKGIAPERLTKILLTHQDDDHMGAAFELLQKYPHIQIVASRVESPYISGQKKNLRLEQAEQLQKLLSEDAKDFGLRFCEQLRQVKPVKVDLEVTDGDRFDWGGGCKIISTPGHTPGHISVFLPQDNVLITGDAAVAEDGELKLANPQFCLDLDAAEQSLAHIRQMACREYICYHGGVWTAD